MKFYDDEKVAAMSREDLLKFAIEANTLLGECRTFLKPMSMLDWKAALGDKRRAESRREEWKKLYAEVEDFVWEEVSINMQVQPEPGSD